MYDFFDVVFYVTRRVTRVHDELGCFDDRAIVITGVIGRNQHAIITLKLFVLFFI